MNPFQTARLKLTLFYLLITTVLLGAATLAAINSEQRAFNRIEQALADRTERPRLTQLLERRLNEFERTFRRNLLILDGILLLLAAGGSYFLSGRTLKPIQQMMTEQEEFAADASHELRTPLTTIGMEIEALKRTHKKLPESLLTAVRNIEDEVSRMTGIVEGLLTLVRTQADLEKHEPIAIDDMVKRAQEQMQKLADNKKITLTQISKTKSYVLATEAKLKQVLIILLDNAIKYTDDGGKVSVSTSEDKSTVKIMVSDTGQGISLTNLPHIFTRYFRGRARHDEERGAGLGLAIAKKIVESLSGKIEVKSIVGKGSTFVVTLPKRS